MKNPFDSIPRFKNKAFEVLPLLIGICALVGFCIIVIIRIVIICKITGYDVFDIAFFAVMIVFLLAVSTFLLSRLTLVPISIEDCKILLTAYDDQSPVFKEILMNAGLDENTSIIPSSGYAEYKTYRMLIGKNPEEIIVRGNADKCNRTINVLFTRDSKGEVKADLGIWPETVTLHVQLPIAH